MTKKKTGKRQNRLANSTKFILTIFPLAFLALIIASTAEANQPQ